MTAGAALARSTGTWAGQHAASGTEGSRHAAAGTPAGHRSNRAPRDWAARQYILPGRPCRARRARNAHSLADPDGRRRGCAPAYLSAPAPGRAAAAWRHGCSSTCRRYGTLRAAPSRGREASAWQADPHAGRCTRRRGCTCRSARTCNGMRSMRAVATQAMFLSSLRNYPLSSVAQQAQHWARALSQAQGCATGCKAVHPCCLGLAEAARQAQGLLRLGVRLLASSRLELASGEAYSCRVACLWGRHAPRSSGSERHMWACALLSGRGA
jgi:hypothetical protein